ncbi:HEAT repeat domain-containing protein [bacterium]|nr:HEAT repeat domain-containing protein [candidate division CSSED10-310 bacterium]
MRKPAVGALLFLVVVASTWTVVSADIAAVMEGLRSDDAQVFGAALKELVALGSKGYAPAVEYIRNEANPNRGRVLAVIDELDAAKAYDLAETYLKASDKDMRVGAVLALGRATSRYAEKSLGKLLKEKDARLRGAAVLALGEKNSEFAREKVLEILKDEKDPNRATAAEALGIMNYVNDQSLGVLIYALRGQDKDLKIAAAKTLGMTDQLAAATELSNLLKDDDPDIREAGKTAFIMLGTKSVSILCGVARNGTELQKVSVAELLGTVDSGKSRETLTDMLTDSSPKVRLAALQSLKNQGAAEALPRITALSHDPDKDVRLLAVKSLEQLGGQSGLSVFITELRDKEPEIRSEAIDILYRLKGLDGLYYVRELVSDPDDAVCAKVRTLIVEEFGAAAVKDLLELLHSPSPEKILVALSILRELAASEPGPVLELLKHPDETVRMAAIDYLAEFGTMAEAEYMDKRYYRSKTTEAKAADEASRRIKFRITGIEPPRVQQRPDDE